MSKRKLLIVSNKIPFPLNQGGAIAQFYFLKYLLSLFEVYFFTIVSNKNQNQQCVNLKEIYPALNIICYNEKNHKISKSFEYKLFVFLKKIRLKITKLFIKKVIVKANNNNLDSQLNYLSEDYIKFFNQLIETNSFDIIQLEFFETITLLPIIPKKIHKIFIHHELRSKRNSLLQDTNLTYTKYISSVVGTLEKSFLQLADRIIVFNDEDKLCFNNLESNIIVSPFGIPRNLIIKDKVSNSFDKFLFTGSEFHYPNKEGLEWFLNSIFIPNSQKIKWPVVITGNWSEQFIRIYSNYRNIIFTGFITNIHEVYENAVMIAPILSGSGVRTKILEAFANKVPVVSTFFASEGLHNGNGINNHILHFNSVESFIELNAKFENNFKYLKEIGELGFNYYCANFSEEILFEKRLKAYNS